MAKWHGAGVLGATFYYTVSLSKKKLCTKDDSEILT